MRQSWETMTSVSAGHIIMTPPQPVGKERERKKRVKNDSRVRERKRETHKHRRKERETESIQGMKCLADFVNNISCINLRKQWSNRTSFSLQYTMH